MADPSGDAMLHRLDEKLSGDDADSAWSVLEPNANQVLCDGTTPLTRAIGFKAREVVGLLLKRNADPNLAESGDEHREQLGTAYREFGEHCEGVAERLGCRLGMTPLMVAAASGDKEVVEHLLECGAEVDAYDVRGFTALHHAAKNDQPAIAGFLIGNDANLKLKTVAGEYAAELAAENRCREVLGILLDAYSTKTLLDNCLLIGLEDPSLVEYLLARGASINKVDRSGRSLLGIAALSKFEETARLLLKKGVSVNGEEPGCKVPPLVEAGGAGMVDFAHELIESGADVNRPNELGETALSSAAIASDRVMMAMLLDLGASEEALVGEESLTQFIKNKRPGLADLIE